MIQIKRTACHQINLCSSAVSIHPQARDNFRVIWRGGLSFEDG
jgi:hypothetical protein